MLFPRLETAWGRCAGHAAAGVMVAQSIDDPGARQHLLVGSLVLVIISIPSSHSPGKGHDG